MALKRVDVVLQHTIKKGKMHIDAHVHNSLLDHCYGLVFGAAIGDSMGSYLEFVKRPSEKQVANAMTMPGGGTWGSRVKSGQVTDDTELAISLCRGLVRMIEADKSTQKQPTDKSDDSDQEDIKQESQDKASAAVDVACYDSAYIAREYYAWYESDPFDAGRCTETTCSQSNARDMQRAAVIYDGMCKQMYKGSAGNIANGSLMRCMPLIVYGHKLSASDLYALMAEDSSLTHANRIVYVANTCYAIAAQYLLQNIAGGDQKDAANDDQSTRNRMAIAAAEAWLNSDDNADNAAAITEVYGWLLDCKHDDMQKLHPAYKFIGFAKIAFQRAFFHLYHASSFGDAMQSTLSEGGDTDTNCCIVGGLLGCYHGLPAIPTAYYDAVMQSKPAADRDCEFQAKLYKERHYIETLIQNAPNKITIKSQTKATDEQKIKKMTKTTST